MNIQYNKIKDAIRGKRALRVTFKGHIRDVCPHAIGHKNGIEKALMFQFAGYSSSGLPDAGDWRCMSVEDLSDIAELGSHWHTGENHTRQQTCIDNVDEEVDY